MLSLPDFKEKKIVVIPAFGKIENILKLRNTNIYLYREDEIINKISCHIIFCIFIVGECTITSKLIHKLKDYGISIFLLNQSFKLYAQLMSQAEGNYKLRHKQYNAPKTLEIELSKIIVKNKIKNQFLLLKQYKKKPDKKLLDNTLSQVNSARELGSILGLEGQYSSYYFKIVFKDLGWYRRAPRTKEDIPNLLLDIGYTYLFNYIDALLGLFGFDNYKGFYHQLFFQRKSLPCDLMEPFRVLIDKQVVKSYNLNQINEKDFKFKNGSYSFKNYEAGKKYIYMWFDLIMVNRESIYEYILGFYRYFQNPEKYLIPEYTFE